MTDYIVSARKYRPESFESLIGQDNIAQTLKNSISRGQLAHAYLFCGPRGVGKTTTARIFAKMINCSHPLGDGEPCGECESCRSFAEGRSYCIFEMDAASNNSVDDIKELIDKVRVAPQSGRYSVYIIDEVHMLSTAAFNAFLKTLEEPPEYAIFILATTEKHKILPTILSRCQTYDFNRITVDNIVRNLRDIAGKERIDIDDESLHVIALKADGAMRDALTIFDQTVAFCGTTVKYEDVIRNLNVLDYEYCFSLVNNFLAGDYASALRTFDEILAKGFNSLHFLSSLSSHFRDLLVARAGGIDSLLELPQSLKKRYHAQADVCSERFIYDALGLTSACEQGYKMAVNPRLHIEFCLMRLCFLNRSAASAAPAPAVTSAPVTAPSPEVTPVQVPASAPVATPALVATPDSVATPAPAPSVQPVQPAKAGEPAQPAQPRRRPFPAAGLSIKAISNDSRETEGLAVPEGTDEIPSDELIMEKWNVIKEEGRNNQRLFYTMDTAVLEIVASENGKTLRYSVINEIQKNWMESLNSRFEARMRSLLGTSRFNMVADLQPEDTSKTMAVSAEDKAAEMMRSNPVVGDMISSLGLEIK